MFHELLAGAMQKRTLLHHRVWEAFSDCGFGNCIFPSENIT